MYCLEKILRIHLDFGGLRKSGLAGDEVGKTDLSLRWSEVNSNNPNFR